MSSSATILATTPLLPWRPAILSPTDSLRFLAMYTLTSLTTPGGSSSPRVTFSISFSSSLSQRVKAVCAPSIAAQKRSLTFSSSVTGVPQARSSRSSSPRKSAA